MDQKKLADSIVTVLGSAHGRLETDDLRAALVEFQDLSEEDLNVALRKLLSDRAINAAHVSSGKDGAIGAFYSIELTPRERDTYDDRKFARLAIEEARKSVHEQDGRPHPKVGAVVVKNGQVLSSAHRGEAAGNHAEFIALEKKLPDSAIAGATVYTTLEPCTTRNHPKIPCADRLIERKVSRVVIGMLDPDPRITGRGQRRLRRANIVTDLFPHDLMTEVEELNREFTRHHEEAPAGFRPIDVSLNCYSDVLPIAVPMGETAYVVGLNEAVNMATFRAVFYRIPNLGSSPLLWPDLLQVRAAKQLHGLTEAQAWRCEVRNNGEVNVVNLNIPLQIIYGRKSDKPYQKIIEVETVSRNRPFVFYVINDCPVEASFALPKTGIAKLAGEQSIREFEFTSAPASFQVSPNYSNWLQMTCAPVADAKHPEQATIAKTTMSRDWPGDWRLMEDGFRRHAHSSLRATWQRASYGAVENWTIHGDQQNIAREVRAFCKQSGKLLMVSPVSKQLSPEIRAHQDDENRWLYFLKEKHGLKELATGTETVGGKTYAVSIGEIFMLAAVSASTCVECAAMSFTD